MLSSHLLADIEHLCDHLILLARLQGAAVRGDRDGARTAPDSYRPTQGHGGDQATHVVVREESTPRQTSLLVRLNGPVIDPAWAVEETNLEEIVLGYMSQDDARYGSGLEAAAFQLRGEVDELVYLAPVP